MKQKLEMIEQLFNKNKYMNSISKGFSSVLGITIFGSIFTLIANFPIPSFIEWLDQSGLSKWLALPSLFTVELISLYASFTIAYAYGKQVQDETPIHYGLVGLLSFLILTPIKTITTIDYEIVNTFDLNWFSAKGLFVAMIAATLSSSLYEWMKKKKWVIRMPNGVPDSVSNSFTSLIPIFLIGTMMLMICILFNLTTYKSIHQFIYQLIQVPLSSLSNSVFAVIIFSLLTSILWWFGIHGAAIVSSVTRPIFLPLSLENLSDYQNGKELKHIYTQTFNNVYNFGGSGMTLSLCLLMIFASKSNRFKALGKLSFAANIFNINEPIIFSIPVILNPVMFIPFVLAPIISVVLAYYATFFGIVPKLIGYQLPWTTPLLISGFIQGGYKVALLQLLILILNVCIYLPFFLYLDRKEYQQVEQVMNK